jgi:hypothetical protein
MPGGLVNALKFSATLLRLAYEDAAIHKLMSRSSTCSIRAAFCANRK